MKWKHFLSTYHILESYSINAGGNAAAKAIGNRVHQISLQFECNFTLRLQDNPLQIL